MPENTLHPVVWKIPEKAKGNCYVFALGPKLGPTGYSVTRTAKSVPGDKCLKKTCCFRDKRFNFTNCAEFKKRILCDNPGYVRPLRSNVSNSASLNKGYHMMCSMLATSGNNDFHFARRFNLNDLKPVEIKRFIRNTEEPAKSEFKMLLSKRVPNNKPVYMWIHQRGWMSGGPVIYDANFKLITNIRRTIKSGGLNYGDLNYDKLCGFFQVKTRSASVR
jgi:hypothetical protein